MFKMYFCFDSKTAIYTLEEKNKAKKNSSWRLKNSSSSFVLFLDFLSKFEGSFLAIILHKCCI